jgi:predicted lactoylglutathione lyase
MYYLYNFINEKQKKWDITIIPELSNLMKLIESKNIFIMMLLIEDNIEAVYIFRKSCADIEKGKEALICIASMNGDVFSTKEFVQGFKVSLWKLLEKEKQHYKFLIVEDTSDNGYIIDNIKIRTYPYAISPTAYFFYNFVYSPFKNNRTFIVN